MTTKTKWAKALRPLVGRTITAVRYMSDLEQAEAGWSRAAVVLTLDDGTLLVPLSDDEGNEAGALQIQPGEIARLQELPDGAPTI